jgi:acetyl esterase/lipase
MIICPGGGYQHLAPHEGAGYAVWLNQHGVNCFVLKYRLGSSGYRHPAMLNDAARAVRWVRAHASEFNVDVKRVGIMGSSAGGHLASTLLTHFDTGDTNSTDIVERQSSRPDLGILCYAVISMGEFTHRGSHNNLIGTNASPELERSLSNELQVTPNTPPCFLWTTYEDKTVAMENTMLFATAMRKNHVPFALHVYEKGPHGMGLGNRGNPEATLHPWAADCLFWLKEQKFVKQ